METKNPVDNNQPRDVLDFAAALGIDLYPWQAEICLTIDQAITMQRKKIAVRGPNGIGKSSRVIALVFVWSLGSGRWLVHSV